MSKAWIRIKRPEFVRDVVRDFCLAGRGLEREFQRFDAYGRVDFNVLRDLLGDEMNKGLLWRLKDTAHHLFRNVAHGCLVGRFLDWCVGYIFHDVIKLKEDAYQQQNYAPWFKEMQDRDLPAKELRISRELFNVLGQTSESIRREILRIRFIMSSCRKLFPLYLSFHKENPLLARFFFAQGELVREVFGSEYEDLMERVYGDRPELMYLLASRSLREGGWLSESQKAVEEAVKINPVDKVVLREHEIVKAWNGKAKR
ncbi:MAG: hypothetical protein SVS15_08400 [Thermodesulfobacteriota bacterium]|nr:hypothetical protein [Thermodesulfobacteriota bacterium]